MNKKLVTRGLLVLLALALVTSTVAYFTLDGIIKDQIETKVTAATGVQTTLDGLELHVLGGAIELDDFAMANPEGFSSESIFEFEDANVDVSLGSLLGDDTLIETLHIDGATVRVELVGTDLNIETLYALIQERSKSDHATTDEPPVEGSNEVGFVIRDLRITHTRLIGMITIPGVETPLTIDTVLADIVAQDVRGAQMGAVIAFVVETVMINASRGLSQISPDLDRFLEGLHDQASAILQHAQDEVTDRVGKKVDEVVPGAGGATKRWLDRKIEEKKQDLLDGKTKQEEIPTTSAMP